MNLQSIKSESHYNIPAQSHLLENILQVYYQGKISLLCSLDGIYRLRPFPAASSLFQNNEWILWHEQLGHLHNDRLLLLFCNGCLNFSKFNKNMSSSVLKSKCTTCCLSTSHTLPFTFHNSRAMAPFDIIHTDD